jgi:hypothetical protein
MAKRDTNIGLGMSGVGALERVVLQEKRDGRNNAYD